MNDPSTETNGTLTIAAIGDLHVRENGERRYRDLFAEISDAADVLVLAGDLTDYGKTSEAEMLAEDLRACTIPAVGVLGNHDYECGDHEKVAEILGQAGITLLDQQATMVEGVGFALPAKRPPEALVGRESCRHGVPARVHVGARDLDAPPGGLAFQPGPPQHGLHGHALELVGRAPASRHAAQRGEAAD